MVTNIMKVFNKYKKYWIKYSMITKLSHHNMSTFFSGTDSSELKENSKHYNYYISLIVNFSHNYCAKIAIPTKTKVTYESWFKNTLGKLVPIKSKKEEDLLLIGDLNVVIEGENTIEWLQNRISVLEEKKKQVTVTEDKFKYIPGNTYSKYNQADLFNNSWRNNEDITPKVFKQVGINEEFLIALLSLDSTTNGKSLEECISKTCELKGEDIDLYDTTLEQNLETLHYSVYGSDDNIRKHCLNILLLLDMYKDSFDNKEILEILETNISVYAV